MAPLEFIQGLLGTKIRVSLRDGYEYIGILRTFDDHINIILSNVEEKSSGEVLFLRSDNILTISETSAV